MIPSEHSHPTGRSFHPIVAQMRPSPEQEPAVTERGRDIVVTAGAGTGKTRTLVARYLSLLAEGLPPRSIVAITFTRKAAREMRNRVREQIRRYLEGQGLDEAQRTRWQELYAELDAARITTIHSLCTEILRAHPAEAGLDPRFDVLDEGQGSILLGRVVDGTLAWAADQEGLVGLFSLLGEGTLRGTLESMVGARLDAQACFATLPVPLWPVWQDYILRPVVSFVDEAGEDIVKLQGVLDDGTLDQAESAGDKLAAPLGRLLDQWEQILVYQAEGDWAAIAARLPALRREMSPYGQAKNWQGSDPRPTLGKLRARYDSQLKDLLGKGLNLALEQDLSEAVPSLQALFDHATGAYERLKEERQALDYDDLEDWALRLLREHEGVRDRWQAEIRALLVDEFQDTNGRQGDLVALLNGAGGRLFIVGDAKQSIYRFRGADVAVFRGERERIARQAGAVFSLETSYRAHRSLVVGLNDLLLPVLGDRADPERPWAEPFAPLRHYRQEPEFRFVEPHIEIHLTGGPKSGGALNRAAEILAARFVELVSCDARVEEVGAKRPLGYGDVAILCRASTSFGPYEDALERAGVPFLTVAGRGFYGRAEVRDLFNILQALADPTDDLVLAGSLRSPALGLSDAALYHLCQARSQAKTSLWDVLCSRKAGDMLSERDRESAGRAAAVIALLHDQVGRTSVADLLKAFLDATDYRAGLIRAGHTRGARNVSKLLADAHASGIVGVGEFLEYATGLRDSGTREGEARATAEGAVQIMTVHAAKGLEFPVVAIGDVTRATPRGRGLLLDRELGPLVDVKNDQRQSPAIYRLGKARSDDKEDAESDRLLYVAATRAREKLILSGCTRVNKSGSLGKLGGWLAKLAAEDALGLAGRDLGYDAEGAGVHHLALHMGSTPVACAIYEPGYRREQNERHPLEKEVAPKVGVSLPPPLLAPVIAPGVGRADDRLAERERVPRRRVWRVVPAVERPRAPAWVVGSMVHEALAAWRFPDGAVGPAFKRWGEARARGYGITDARQLKDAVDRARKLLLRFRADALYTEMNGAEKRLHEVPYSYAEDGRVESGIIDALYQWDGRWTVVEFKTDRVKDQSELERVLEEEGYRAQALRYVTAVERLLGQRPRCALCMLNYEGEVHLAWILEAR